jgi:hypothetical protein
MACNRSEVPQIRSLGPLSYSPLCEKAKTDEDVVQLNVY